MATTSCPSSRGPEESPRKEIYYFGQGGELNAIRVQNWKIHFATVDGQYRDGRPTDARLAVDHQSARPIRMRKCGRKVNSGTSAGTAITCGHSCPRSHSSKSFLKTIPDYPFQSGSSLNAGGINYQSLKAADVLKKLETLDYPRN